MYICPLIGLDILTPRNVSCTYVSSVTPTSCMLGRTRVLSLFWLNGAVSVTLHMDVSNTDRYQNSATPFTFDNVVCVCPSHVVNMNRTGGLRPPILQDVVSKV